MVIAVSSPSQTTGRMKLAPHLLEASLFLVPEGTIDPGAAEFVIADPVVVALEPDHQRIVLRMKSCFARVATVQSKDAVPLIRLLVEKNPRDPAGEISLQRFPVDLEDPFQIQRLVDRVADSLSWASCCSCARENRLFISRCTTV